MSDIELLEMLAKYEDNKLSPINTSASINGVNALEVNNVLKLLDCPEVAINKESDNNGSNLYISAYYMILRLAARIETLEKYIGD